MKMQQRFLFLQDPELLADHVEEVVELGFIDVFDLLEEVERVSERLGDGDEGLDVLRKARAAVAEAGIEEGATDAGIISFLISAIRCSARGTSSLLEYSSIIRS